jgi:DNA primase
VLRHGLSTEGKIRIVSELQSYLGAINDSVARALYVKQLAERIRLDETVILERLKALAGPTAAGRSGSRSDAAGPSPSVPAERFEQRIIAMMLQFPEILPEIVKGAVLEDFANPLLKSAGETLLRHRLNSPEQLPELLAKLDEGPLRQTLVALAMSDESWTRKVCKALLRQFMESRQKQASGHSMQAAIEAAEREQNEAEVMRLLSEKQKLAVRREKQKMSALREK